MAEYIRQEAIINRIKEYASERYGIDLYDPLQIAGKALTIEFVKDYMRQ